MQYTIIIPDNVMLIDGKSRNVDCSELKTKSIHAVQWDDVLKEGHIEYSSDYGRVKQPNLTIKKFDYQKFIDKWNEEDTRIANEEKAKKEEKVKLEAERKAKHDSLIKEQEAHAKEIAKIELEKQAKPNGG